MAHQPINRQLPALRKLLPGFAGFAPTERVADGLVRQLREVTRHVQGPRTRPFYTQQEVARFFGTSLWSVARAFKALEADGLLAVMRGSGTMLYGRKLQPRRPIKGVIGLVIWRQGFIDSAGWRLLFDRLDAELRQHRFVTDYIFNEARDWLEGDLTERIIEHSPDLVVWFVPSHTALEPLRIMRDHGIPTVLIGDGKIHSPAQQYQLEYGSALRRALRGWRADGIGHVAVFRTEIPGSGGSAYRVSEALTAARLPHEFLPCTLGVFRRSAAGRAKQQRTGVVFCPSDFAQEVTYRDPSAFERLCRRHRVLVLAERVQSPAFEGRDIWIDLITPDWQGIAHRVAQDIGAQSIPPPECPTVFSARWHPRVNLGQPAEDPSAA